MGTDTKLRDEAGRLAALERYEVLDTPPEHAFDRITGLVSTVMGFPICTVTLIDTDRQWFKSCVGLAAREGRRDTSFCTHTIQQREPLCIPDATQDPRFANNPLVTGEPYIRSYLGVPLATPDGYNVGSFCVIDRVPRDFSEKQVEIMKSFAALVVDELEMRRIAQTDHLTGVATRRSFLLELEKALAQHRRSRRPTALVLLDIDHFKRVNDTYGHAAGDCVLVTVAKTLAGLLRSGDSIGRLGGEEFGILLQDTGEGSALETAERLRAQIERCPVEFDAELQVTASFGVAVLEAGVSSVQEWLVGADEALYEAKRTGRNRCCNAKALAVQEV